MTETFQARLEVPVSAEELYAWHVRPGALTRLAPPWEETNILHDDGVREGGRTVLEVAIGPVHERWVAVHRDVDPGRGFTDEQIEGPFVSWVHRHQIDALGSHHAALTDTIEYRLPLGALGRLVGGSAVRRRIERMFVYRHAVLADDLRRHAEHRGRRLRVAITGQSGLIGRALSAMLTTGGHEVLAVVRRAPTAGEIAWDPAAGTIESDKLAEVDAVVHLAGENIGDGRWTEAKKTLIRESRVHGTQVLSAALARLRGGPCTLVSASAIGWYGDRKEAVDEHSAGGEGFLAEVCEAWERAADPARAAGIRVVHPRTGVVLTPLGGALPQLITAFKVGVGGKVGRGDQGLSWIALDDVVAGLHAALLREELDGPVNLCAPDPVDSAGFARVLGEVLHRPSVVPLPEAAVRVTLGEKGEALLLEGARVRPGVLLAAGHRFTCPELTGALRHLLGR
jgi:uncharacterized protein (TIGR01777 family)